MKTKVLQGSARLDADGLHVEGSAAKLLVPSSDILQAQLFRLHGLGRVIRLDHAKGRLFLSAVRFMIGQFASINFFKTGKLHKDLSAIADQNKRSAPSR